MFKELEQGAREDVEAAQALVPPRYETKFSVAKGASRRFSVVRVDDPMTSLSHSVDFAHEED